MFTQSCDFSVSVILNIVKDLETSHMKSQRGILSFPLRAVGKIAEGKGKLDCASEKLKTSFGFSLALH